METESFFEQFYSERQLIVFVDDAAIIATQKPAEALPQKSEPDPDSQKSVPLWANVWANVAAFGLPMTAAIFGTRAIVSLTSKPDLETIKSSNQAKEKGVENLVLVGKSKIAYFKLPPGHPRNRIVYAGHPAIPEVYVPLADFHRLTFEHKFSEVISLLMHLGAKTIKVEHVTGWGTDFSSRLNIGLPSAVPLTTDISVEANANQKKQQTLLFNAELDNSHPPSLPDDLVWYPYESTWQQVANGRLKFRLKNLNLTLNYNDDYGINAQLGVKIGGAGLDAGGAFENHAATTWRIYGNF